MITLFTGPMGSGKSAYLIKEIKKVLNNTTLVFKPTNDIRSIGCINSRNGQFILAHEVHDFKDILKYVDNMFVEVKNIFIDELQFLSSDGLADFIINCKKRSINIYAAGLNLTSELKCFNTTGQFACYCDEIFIIQGSCEKCGSNKASLSEYVFSDKKEEFLVGSTSYISVCDKCHKIIND